MFFKMSMPNQHQPLQNTEFPLLLMSLFKPANTDLLEWLQNCIVVEGPLQPSILVVVVGDLHQGTPHFNEKKKNKLWHTLA